MNKFLTDSLRKMRERGLLNEAASAVFDYEDGKDSQRETGLITVLTCGMHEDRAELHRWTGVKWINRAKFNAETFAVTLDINDFILFADAHPEYLYKGADGWHWQGYGKVSWNVKSTSKSATNEPLKRTLVSAGISYKVRQLGVDYKDLPIGADGTRADAFEAMVAKAFKKRWTGFNHNSADFWDEQQGCYGEICGLGKRFF